MGKIFAPSGNAGLCECQCAMNSESGAPAPRQRRVIPTSVAPITFFVREDADWMTPRHPGAQPGANSGLGHGAQLVLDFLRQRGASFFADIVRGTGKLKAEIETALWELVAAGLVTADGFDNLRSLIDPKRRAGQGSGRTMRPRHNAGRWALLHADEVVERPRAVEAACWMLLAPLRNRDPRCAGPRGESSALARIADGLPPAGRSRRDSRRPFCRWISRRAVCFAGRGGVGAGNAQARLGTRNDYAICCRSVESGGNSGSGRSRARDFGQQRYLSRWGRGFLACALLFTLSSPRRINAPQPKKIRDPMRGPLGSLIAQLSKTVSKSASPIAFCQAVAHFILASCLPVAKECGPDKSPLPPKQPQWKLVPLGWSAAACSPLSIQVLLSDQIAILSVRILEQFQFEIKLVKSVIRRARGEYLASQTPGAVRSFERLNHTLVRWRSYHWARGSEWHRGHRPFRLAQALCRCRRNGRVRCGIWTAATELSSTACACKSNGCNTEMRSPLAILLFYSCWKKRMDAGPRPGGIRGRAAYSRDHRN